MRQVSCLVDRVDYMSVFVTRTFRRVSFDPAALWHRVSNSEENWSELEQTVRYGTSRMSQKGEQAEVQRERAD
jgi:hypothetical protein